ncbi:MAG TPA: nicotinate phosphoribosyltransferase [Stellaceae bacterium]|nr:nicotinate phosphoribosyltransferase [Stellaceae bacterium]
MAESPQSDSLLLTDLYQLAMLQAYREHGLTDTAVFEFFVRKLPAERGFLMAGGLAQALSFLETARFSDHDRDALHGLGRFPRSFVDSLADFRFTGDVDALPEGTIFFPDEPILRVVAPLPQAQLVETRLVNLLHFQTVIASKAARMVLAAPGKQLVDFGLRRAHGAEAGLLAARAAYVAGFSGTATLEAALRFGIPVYGTMAHSFIQAHDDETVAFEHFARSRRDGVVLLIDTYDTEQAAEKVARLAHRLAGEGIPIRGVRLDSGDLAAHARRVRAILDANDLRDVTIFASGGLDENALKTFGRAGAPIDGYGVGTSLTTSSDAPALDCAYKLQEYAGVARRKRSEGKATWPGRKQVWRRYASDGSFAGDVLGVESEAPSGEPLLHPVMRAGRPVSPSPEIGAVRAHAADQLRRLPAVLRRLETEAYPVAISNGLRELAAACDRRTSAV